MSHLEPSYLRYIYDGLEKGDLHPDNAAALPEGLTGLYEAAFEESKPARERQKLIETFAIWALLKKEVSSQFVAEILEVPIQEIVDFIATYSSWFTSPESGKYQLYHERLKVFLLQKLSEQEITALHNKLITRLEQPILEQKEDEFELYGLEFLSAHYFTTAMITEDGEKLISLSYSQNHLQRQLKLSKGFEWTKKGLKQVMTWASKFNDDEVIECGLQMVDLNHQEQNDAPQIVALVADGEIEAALKRIEAFGGNDKEGLQRKFILYMLCLMELTLLESKDKPFRKEAIENILKHFEENIPVDPSLIDWTCFFSPYLIFTLTVELKKIEIDYKKIFERSFEWSKELIKQKKAYTKFEFEILLEYARGFNSDKQKVNALSDIFSQLYRQGEILESISVIEEVLEYSKNIGELTKNKVLVELTSDIAKTGKIDLAYKCVNDIDDNYLMIISQNKLIIELAKQGNIDEAEKYIKSINDNFENSSLQNYYLSTALAAQGNFDKSIKYLDRITDKYEKFIALKVLTIEMFKNNKKNSAVRFFQKAIFLAKCSNDNAEKSKMLKILFTELMNVGKSKFAFTIMEELLISTRKIEDKFSKIVIILDILKEINKKSEFELEKSLIKEVIEIAQNANDNDDKSFLFREISKELFKQGNINESDFLIKAAFDYACKINDDFNMSSSLNFICIELVTQGKLDLALECFHKISDEYWMSNTIIDITTILKKNDKIIDLKKIILASISNTQKNINFNYKNNLINDICTKLIKQGKLKDAKNLAYINEDELFKIKLLLNISKEFINQGKFDVSESIFKDVISFSKRIDLDSNKIELLIEISSELFKQNKKNEAELIIKEALLFARNNNDEFALSRISTELAKQSMFDEALLCARNIKSDIWKSSSLKLISTELLIQNTGEMSEIVIHESLQSARKITTIWQKSEALNDISFELFKQGKSNEAASIIYESLEYSRMIKDETVKIRRLVGIISLLSKLEKEDESTIVMNEAIENAIKIDSKWKKEQALRIIALNLLEYKNVDDAISCTQLIEIGWNRDTALIAICEKLAKNNRWDLLELLSFKISSTELRYNCWGNIGYELNKIFGVHKSIYYYKNFKKKEAQKFYLKGWAKSVNLIDINQNIVLLSSKIFEEDIEAFEQLLNIYSLNELFFENLPEEKIQRFNRTLNIQWAIDIKNQLSN